MEGHERANVEARIKCLRNIQVLLDAAVMEMQQYSSVVSQLDVSSRRPSPAATVEPSRSADASTANPPKPQPTAETGARPKVKAEDKNTTESDTKSDENDQVRKRRLERFESPPSNHTNNTSD